jgi:hypothetical protein
MKSIFLYNRQAGKWAGNLLLLCLLTGNAFAQVIPRNIKTTEYKALQASLATGWNTWYNNSVLTHVLLPQGLSISLCLSGRNNADYLKEVLPASGAVKRPEKVIFGLRSDDGSYTSLRLQYKGIELSVQTATAGADQLILVTPVKPAAEWLVVEAGLLWGARGSIGSSDTALVMQSGTTSLLLRTTEAPVSYAYAVTTAPRLVLPLLHETGIYTGRYRSLADISTVIARARQAQEKRIAAYGSMAASFQAIQSTLAWNTIYDAPNQRVITPVSRWWSYRWAAGFVLFDWDTYFAGYMLSLFNKKLAYANAIEITKAITANGFVPNYQSSGRGSSEDRSQPPVGSTMILHIYKQHREKWFLQEVYDELLTWNRWWPAHRRIGNYLSWGCDYTALPPGKAGAARTYACYESGLDNSPMFDRVPFDTATHTLQLADVGLMSLYIADCKALAEIATVLDKKKDADELLRRAATYSVTLNTLWDEQAGAFLNKRLHDQTADRQLTPTCFYPLLANACTPEQASRMIQEHYFNPQEFYGEYVIPSVARNAPAFKDNDYWRGRIWGPLNFLVYLGMRNYDVPAARADLISRSRQLFMKHWLKDGSVYENYNAVTGEGSDVVNADAFYHWGALLVFIEFIEKGYVK